MSDSQHTIAGTVLTMPVRVRKADVHTAMFSVPADAAQRLVDYSGLKVCEFRPGRAVVNLMLARYIDVKILDRSPFETLDTPGVGQLIRMGGWLGRKTNPDLALGVCGEHGGDPDSIEFLSSSGIDYVSCSPYRVPIARVAAAQAAIRARRGAGA